MGNVQTYKRTHLPKPLTEDKQAGKPHQGVYVPKHPEKVIGGAVITRSGWEFAFARWCDDNPSVLEWGSEPCAIQYRNPGAVNMDACRKANVSPMDPLNWPINDYYPDFYVMLRTDDDTDGTDVVRLLIEIKPYAQTQRPVPPPTGAKLQEQKRFVEEVKTFLQNTKKWEAATVWAKDHNMDFKVFTENELQKMGVM